MIVLGSVNAKLTQRRVYSHTIMTIFRTYSIVAVLAVSLLSTPVDAFKSSSAQHVLETSGMCIKAFTRSERKYGIPKHLLMAVANTESGRYHPKLKRVVPWPWTLNIHGKGSYHNNYHDTVTAVKRAKQSGQRSIDVGCMQVNLKHHPEAFSSITEALDPSSNVDYAASFLRSNFDELGSWPKAIAAYHSRSPSRGSKYYAMVKKRWRDVRQAIGGSMLQDTDYMTAGVNVRHLTPSKYSSFDIAMSDGSGTRQSYTGDTAPFGVAKKPARHNSMKIIKVTTKPRGRDDMVVTVTPVSRGEASSSFVTMPSVKGKPRVVRPAPLIEKTPIEKPTQQASAESGFNRMHTPNFIFGR